MQLLRNRQIQIVLGVAVLLLLSLIGLAAFQSQAFRLKSVSPEGKVSDAITQITFTFSHDLANSAANRVTVSPATTGTFIVNKDQLIFKPTSQLSKGPLTFSFKNIESRNGKKIDNLTKELTVGFVEYNQLSKEEQKRQVDQSSGGQNFDLLNGFLPHAAYNYTLDYAEPEAGEGKLILVIDVYDRDVNQTQKEYVASLEQARKDMLAYVEKNKGSNSMDDFYFLYNSEYLSKYNVSPPAEEDDHGHGEDSGAHH